jgi:hypothetical protein
MTHQNVGHKKRARSTWPQLVRRMVFLSKVTSEIAARREAGRDIYPVRNVWDVNFLPRKLRNIATGCIPRRAQSNGGHFDARKFRDLEYGFLP